MSSIDRVTVSREVLETMLSAVSEARQDLYDIPGETPQDAGQREQRAQNRLLDVQIALESLCKRLG